MRRSVRIGLALVLLVATCVGVGLILTQSAEAHGTCANHQYRTYDGTHDGDGDGVGCESKPAPPGRIQHRLIDHRQYIHGITPCSAPDMRRPPVPHLRRHARRGRRRRRLRIQARTALPLRRHPPSTSVGYDRDNWSFGSSGARARLGCSSSEHVDHIVALKEAYDSGAAAWSSTRKAEFANDSANLWCLAASVNLSKSDGDLAEWAGGSCAQRKRIATVTQQVKRTYGLSTDGAEQRAITAALAAQCTPLTDSQSGTTESSVKRPAERRGVERRRRLVSGCGVPGRRQQPSRGQPTRVVLHPAAVARHRPRPAPHGLLPRRQLASARPQQLTPHTRSPTACGST